MWSLSCKMFQKRPQSVGNNGSRKSSHLYNTPLSKESAINWRTAHSTLAITLLSFVSCTTWFKELGSGSPSAAKSWAISWQCLAYDWPKPAIFITQEEEGVVQCQWDSIFSVCECNGGGCEHTGLEKSIPAAKATAGGSTSGLFGWRKALNKAKRLSKKYNTHNNYITQGGKLDNFHPSHSDGSIACLEGICLSLPLKFPSKLNKKEIPENLFTVIVFCLWVEHHLQLQVSMGSKLLNDRQLTWSPGA